MKKLLLSFGFLVLSVSLFGDVQADPFVAGKTNNSSTGTTGKGTAIPASPSPTSGGGGTSTATSTATSTTPASSGPTLYEVKLQEPLSGQASTLVALNGVDLINQYISMIYMWMASIVGIIAVLMLVVSGIQIVFGGASPELVSDAKTRVTQSLLSLVLLFATALILKTINPGFFGFM